MKRLIGFTLAAVLIGGGCTCLDTSGFHPYACDVDGGDAQCPGDGVCGLEGVCHARGDEQAWRCQDDSHCEGSWRCGPEGVCLDPDREALVPSEAGALTAARIGNLLPDGLPSHVAGSGETVFLPVPTCYEGGTPVGDYRTYELPAKVTSLVLDGGLYTVVKWDAPRPALPDGGFLTVSDCLGYPGGVTPSRALDVVRVPAPPVVDLAAAGGTTYVLEGSGVVCRYRLNHLLEQDPSGDCAATFSSASPPQRLRLTDGFSSRDPLLLGVGADHVQLHNLDGGITEPVRRIALPDGGMAPVHDAIAIGRQHPLLLAATPAGVFARQLDGKQISDGGTLKDDTHWEPVASGFGTFCGESLAATPPATPLRFGVANDGQVVLVHHRNDLGNGQFDEQLSTLVAVDFPPPFPAPAECVYPPSVISTPGDPSGYMPWTTCRPCPANSQLRWFRLAYEGSPSYPMLEARCSNPDGGSADLSGLDPSGRCDPFGFHASGLGLTAPLEGARHHRPVVADTASVAGLTLADDLGHLWQPEGAWALYPWTLDRAPEVVFRDQALIALRGEETHGRNEGTHDPLPVLEALPMEEGPLGFVRGSPSLQIKAGVQGQPRWLLVREFQEVGPPVVGVLELLDPGSRGTESAPRRALAFLPEALDFGAPYQLTTSVTSDGRTVLLLATADTLLAADLTQPLAALPPGPYATSEFFAAPELAVKLTAVIHSPVQSLTTLAAPSAPGAGPQFVSGYLVQGFRLFSFQASNLNVWRTEEILLRDPTEPLAVFADGVRGRVGMKSGTVYSLPSKLVLADALPAAAQPVTEYQQHCGQLLAVAADGLYRLAVGTEPRGLWERVPVPDHHRFPGGRLFWEGETLRFFTADGVALTLSGFTCRAPAAQ